MPWLLRGEEVLAAVEVAESRRDRMRGLLGRERVDGAFVLKPCRSVHTVGMRFPIDVAFCSRDMTVLRIVHMRPNRVTRPSLRGSCVIEAESGAFERWKLRPGDLLEIRS